MIDLALKLSLALGAGCLVACSALDNCPESKPARDIEEGTTDSESLVYESAPWEGPLHEFPAKTRLRFFHELAATPQFVTTYLSFSESGTGSSDATENSGNQGRIECVDARLIQIRNDTCENFYIRVVAQATPASRTDITCD
jgi:hypothetical protein